MLSTSTPENNKVVLRSTISLCFCEGSNWATHGFICDFKEAQSKLLNSLGLASTRRQVCINVNQQIFKCFLRDESTMSLLILHADIGSATKWLLRSMSSLSRSSLLDPSSTGLSRRIPCRSIADVLSFTFNRRSPSPVGLASCVDVAQYPLIHLYW